MEYLSSIYQMKYFCEHEPYLLFVSSNNICPFFLSFNKSLHDNNLHTLIQLTLCHTLMMLLFVKWKNDLHTDVFLKGYMTSGCKTCLHYVWN